MPPADTVHDRCLWVAALINPLPSLGVAWEVRPGLLKAMSSDERVRLAVAAIKASIEHLQGRGGAARD